MDVKTLYGRTELSFLHCCGFSPPLLLLVSFTLPIGLFIPEHERKNGFKVLRSQLRHNPIHPSSPAGQVLLMQYLTVTGSLEMGWALT